MPAVQTIERVKYDRAPIIILVTKEKQPLNLTGEGTIQIEVIEAGQSTFKTRAGSGECTYYTNGTDGKLSYNPPAAGWEHNVQLCVWLDTGGTRKRAPENGELEIRIREVGSVAPS